MSYYNERLRRFLVRRTGDWLRLRAWPRTTAAMAMTLAVVSSHLCATMLLFPGARSAAVRFALGGLVGYVMYLLWIGLWFLRVSPIEAKSLLIDGPEQIHTDVPGESRFDDWLDDSARGALEQANQRTNDAIAVLVFAAVLGVLYVVFHVVYHAPWYLGKLLVDGGKTRHRTTPAGNTADFVVLPLLQSWPVAVILVVHYTMLGLVFQAIRGAA